MIAVSLWFVLGYAVLVSVVLVWLTRIGTGAAAGLAALLPLVVRAFFVASGHARQGIGGRILKACEEAAAARGFSRLELMSTLPGFPFYSHSGFLEVERVIDTLPDGTAIEFVRMTRRIFQEAEDH